MILFTRFVIAACATLSAAVPLSAAAQDSVLGTFTVNGKTTRFNHIYATMEATAPGSSDKYLMLLVSDVPLAATDRTPDRLLALAKSGKINALRLRWHYGYDGIAVVPYHPAIAESGQAFESLSTMNLSELDDKHVHAEFKAKMLGQTWFFNALIKAAIVNAGVAVLEPRFVLAESPGGVGVPAEADAIALKRSLGGMGYEYKPDAFFQAIADRNAKAVTLFLKAGMSPNQKDDQGRFPLNYSVLFCTQSQPESEAVIKALLDGKADVRSRDPDNGTTALVWAAGSCSVGAVEALINAKSDLTAKSNGGATALQIARSMGRQDVVTVLEKAGAK
jgi:hypothetical protein